MVPFSGWIKYLLRWALLIILFLQCLKRSQDPAFWKQLSLACTWKMYESDTHFYSPSLPTPNWQQLHKSHENTWLLWPTVGFRKKIKPFDILLLSRILVYIVMYYCKVDLWGLVQRGWPSQNHNLSDRAPERSSSSWHSEILFQFPVVIPLSSGVMLVKPALCRLSAVHFKTICLSWWLLFSLKEKKTKQNKNNSQNS